MGIFTGRWPFFISGLVLAGTLLAWLFIFDQPMSVVSALAEAGEEVKNVADNGRMPTAISFTWQIGLVAGVVIGALAGALLSGNFKFRFFFEDAGNLFQRAGRTLILSVIGGFLVMTGFLIVAEELFGQLLSAMELAVGAWIFLAALFAVGAIAAVLLERRSDSSSSGGGE